MHSIRQNKMKHPLFRVEIKSTELTMMADSGSSISILDEQDYNKMKLRPSLEDTTVKICTTLTHSYWFVESSRHG